jgi:hypothetical protein
MKGQNMNEGENTVDRDVAKAWSAIEVLRRRADESERRDTDQDVRLDAHDEKFIALKDYANHLWNERRPEECLGRADLAKHLRDHETADQIAKKEEESMKIEGLNMLKLQLDAEKARRDSRTTLIVAVIGVLGTWGLGLLDAFKAVPK